MTNYDVIVVGAGAMGMSAGYFLADKGQKILMIDAFNPRTPLVVIMEIRASCGMRMEKVFSMYL